MKKARLFVCIYPQGGSGDRSLETKLERRLFLTHTGLAGEKINACVNPYPTYIGGG